MRISNLLRLYVVRLRARFVGELFAIAGVAVGVALLFSAQVAQNSLSGSIRALQHGIAGKATYEVTARGPEGFPETVTKEVQATPGVVQAAPVLEVSANIVGPSGQRSVDLIGAEPQIAALGGSLLQHIDTTSVGGLEALTLPQPIANGAGISLYGTFTLQVAGNDHQTFLGEVLDEGQIGGLIHNPVAIGSLSYVRQLAGQEDRANRLLVEPARGSEVKVHAALERIAAGRLDVRKADFEAALVDQAAFVTNQSTDLFSAISALVGFLFAFNAIRMTLSHRRKLVEDLRLDGYGPGTLTQILLLDALVLGLLASVIGLALGELLSNRLFGSGTAYLSLAFPIGSERIIPWQTVPIALAGGLILTLASVLGPFRGLRSQRDHLGAPSPTRAASQHRLRIAGGLALAAISTLIVLVDPTIAAIATVGLAFSLILLLPSLIAVSLRGLGSLGKAIKKPAPLIALTELRSTVTRTRSVAVAATGAIALFGTVAIDGARTNLQDGLNQTTHEISDVADVWVTARGAGSPAAISPIHPIDLAPLEHLPGVAAIRTYDGSAFDWGTRRLWVIAPPRQASAPVPPSELVEGNIGQATDRIRASDWVVLSQPVAEEHHLRIGESFVLPSPIPTRFRVAALSTNIDWPPGAIIMNADDYARAWSTQQPTAYNVIVSPGGSPSEVSREIQTALAGQPGLVVETAREREQHLLGLVTQAVTRIGQISLLVLIAAILAMTVTMGDLIWQRRTRLAAMKVDGIREDVLWRSLMLESALLMGCGCTTGALFGLYAQPLLGHALTTLTGFPVVATVRIPLALELLALVSGVAVAMLAIPGRIAARVNPRLSLGE